MQVEAAGVGKITKQNTPADVKPVKQKRQVLKFGNKVDKDGRPHYKKKKVKGSKPSTIPPWYDRIVDNSMNLCYTMLRWQKILVN